MTELLSTSPRFDEHEVVKYDHLESANEDLVGWGSLPNESPTNQGGKATASLAAGNRPHFRPYSTATLVAAAKRLLAASETTMARQLLAEALTIDPFNEPAIKHFAISFEKQGEEMAAYRCYLTLANYHMTFENLVFLGHSLYRQGRDDEALSSYQMAMRKLRGYSPLLATVYRHQGNIYVKQGDLDGAEEYYNRSLALKANCDILFVNYGTLEIQRDNWTAAAGRFRSAIATNSKNDKAWVGLALVHRYHGDHELAWANLLAATEIAPNNATAVRLASEWGIQDAQWGATQEILQNYLSIEFTDVEVSLMLVKLFVLQNKLGLAAIEMERALLLAPRQSAVLELYDQITKKQDRRE